MYVGLFRCGSELVGAVEISPTIVRGIQMIQRIVGRAQFFWGGLAFELSLVPVNLISTVIFILVHKSSTFFTFVGRD